MKKDPTNGYEEIAPDYIHYRKNSITGAKTVRSWANTLGPGAVILDLGCGGGIPITKTLVQDGHTLYGADASPTLISSYRKNFPDIPAACEPFETSSFFDRKFDGVVAWGLMFLLSENAQSELIHRVANILNPGGQFLFTSTEDICTWTDVMTAAESRSLGVEKYNHILTSAGFSLIGNNTDEGNNFYYCGEKK